MTQLKQTNLENQLHILTESLKEGLNDGVFQNLVDELNILVSVFLCLCSNICGCYVTFQGDFFVKCFAFFSV